MKKALILSLFIFSTFAYSTDIDFFRGTTWKTLEGEELIFTINQDLSYVFDGKGKNKPVELSEDEGFEILELSEMELFMGYFHDVKVLFLNDGKITLHKVPNPSFMDLARKYSMKLIDIFNEK